MPEDKATPYFSVIVPVYNKAEHIGRSIASVLSQTFRDYELIIVCDPSTDSSNEEVQKFQDHRIRVFYRSQPGPGGYAARNLGIRNALGKYIAFLDADDEWWSGHLEYHRALISRSDEAVVATSWHDCFDSEEQHCFVKEVPALEEMRVEFSGLLRRYVSFENVVHTNTITIRKDVFAGCGGFPEGECKRGGDVATWIKVVAEAGSIFLSSRKTAVYHREDSTVTREYSPDVENNCVRLHVDRLLNEIDWSKHETELLKKLANKHVLYGLVGRASMGSLTAIDSSYLYPASDPYKFWFFRLYGVLPGRIQRLLWTTYRRLKK